MSIRRQKWFLSVNLFGSHGSRAARRRRKATSRSANVGAFGRRLSLLEHLETRDLLTAVVVNSINDDATPVAGQTTLRDAINAVNASADATNSITFDSSVFSSAQTITLTQGRLNILNNVTITGPASGVTISGDNQSQVFAVGDGVSHSPTVGLADLTIANGYSTTNGGGIVIATGSTLNVLNSAFVGNSAGYDGGGLYNYNGTATLTNCTFTGNTGNYGGAIKDYTGTAATTTLNDCTIAGNAAPSGGAGVDTFGSVVLNNTIVADSLSIEGSGSITGDHDLLAGGASGASLTNSQFNTNPLLGSFGNYGGPTQTFPLLAGSPAIDAGSNALIPAGITTDQRGAPRVSGASVDIGAYEAQIILVDNSGDGPDDGNYAPGAMTLRKAVDYANQDPGSNDFIYFAPTLAGQTITLTDGPLVLLQSMTITGPPDGVTISGNNQSQVFVVGDGGSHSPTVELADLTVTQGKASSNGGGIVNSMGSTLTVLDSTISDNNADGDGGGLYNFNGTVNLTNCTLTGNISYDGAALKDYAGADAVMTVSNCTIADNVSYDGGGAIDTYGTVVLNNSILANNISSTPGTFSLYIEGTGTITGGNDLIYDSGSGGSSSGAVLANSMLNTASPLLGNLGNYGGPTQTFPLLAGSPAIDAGSNSLIPAGITTDQRGLPRIVDGTVDIGAFELQNPEALFAVITIAGPTGSPVYGQQETFTASVTFGGAALAGGTVNFLDGGSVLASGVALNSAGQATFQTSLLSAGSHTIEAHYNGTFGFSPSDTSTGAAVDVAKANATIVVTPYSVTYNGNAHVATGTATGVNGENLAGELNLSGTTHTNAGTYNGDAWSFAGDSNYNAANGTVNDSIAQAAASVVVSGYTGGVYDGSLHSQTVTVTGVGNDGTLFTTSLAGTNAGSYSLPWSFTNGNYLASDESGTLAFTIAKTSPQVTGVTVATSDPTLGATNVVLGTGDSFTASATLSGGVNETGTITFTLLAPNGTAVYTDAVPVSGNGTYSSGMTGTVTGSPVPAVAGTYQWNVAYSGDGNNAAVGPTANVPETAVGPGATVVGGALYLVGGNAGDWIFVNPVGKNSDGSTGVVVNAWLNGAFVSQSFGTTTPVTSIVVAGFGGNDNIVLDPRLTIPATVVEGGGNDNIALGNANNSVTAGDGNDNIFAAGGNNAITAGNGNDNVQLGLPGFLQWLLPSTPAGNNTVTLGNGNDNVSAGDGNNIVTIGNGNGNVNLGNGNNQVTVVGGQPAAPAQQGGWWAQWFGGGPSAANIQLGNGNNAVTAGDSNVNVTAGNGNNTVHAGNGNDSVQLGDGNNTVVFNAHPNSGGGKNGGGAGGAKSPPAGQTANSYLLGGAAATSTDNVQFGNGNNSVTAGDSNLNVTGGNGSNTVLAGNGNDSVRLGTPQWAWSPKPATPGNNIVSLGNGNDQVTVGDGGNTVSVGGGNDCITAGDGNNVIVAGGGNDDIRVGDGDNLIVGGGGHDSVRAGNGNNILIDGSVAQTTDQLWAVLDQWMADIKAGGAAATIANDLSGLASAITYNTTNANTLHSGRGFDAFFATYGKDHVNAKPGDLLNGNVVTKGH